MKALLVLASLATLIVQAEADVLTGRAVDLQGAGVANANIDIFDQINGGELSISNDGTDAFGNFSIVVPAGLYQVVVNPPAAPTYFPTTLDDVAVIGVTDIGDVTLLPGAYVSGRVIRQNGSAVVNIDIDVVLATGEEIDAAGDFSDAQGMFEVLVPAVELEMQFDPTNVIGGLLAPENIYLTPIADVNLGDLVLRSGFVLSMTVRRPNGSGVQNADLDVIDVATGVERYTPGDNTSATGFVDVVLPAGTYDIEVCPPHAARLVAEVLAGVNVSTTTNLGVTTLANGVELSGLVRDAGGTGIPNVDIDVSPAGGGAPLLLCADNTNASGVFAVIVPTGTYDVNFDPSNTTLSCGLTQPNVVVNADKVMSVTLADCDPGTTIGVGVAGSGGFVPTLSSAGGCPRTGNDEWSVTLDNGLGGATAYLFATAGSATAGAPGAGGVAGSFGPARLIARPLALTLSGLSGAAGVGSATQPITVPDEPALLGLTLRVRGLVFDAGAPGGRARSRVLRSIICE